MSRDVRCWEGRSICRRNQAGGWWRRSEPTRGPAGHATRSTPRGDGGGRAAARGRGDRDAESGVCRSTKPGQGTSTGGTWLAHLGTFGWGRASRGAGGVPRAEWAAAVTWAEARVEVRRPRAQRAGGTQARAAGPPRPGARRLGADDRASGAIREPPRPARGPRTAPPGASEDAGCSGIHRATDVATPFIQSKMCEHPA